MAPKRKYNIKDTKDFLILAIVLTVLCIWAVVDGWFPPRAVLKKHPLELPLRFEREGLVTEVHVKPGQGVSPGMVLASQAMKTAQQALNAAEEAYKKAREDGSETDLNAAAEKIRRLREEVAAYEITAEKRYKIEYKDNKWFAEPADPEDRAAYEFSGGKVKEVPARQNRYVKVGDLAAVIHPSDTFYAFNKSLAIFTAIGALVFFVLHVRLNRT
jgi:multidrug resistance efflux pump